MRKLAWIVSALLVAVPLTVVADPGDVVTDYGEDGRAPIESVTESVGVVDFVSDLAGHAVISIAGDAESGFGALVSADGAEVADLEFDSPSEVAFGPDGYVYVAGRSTGSAVVSRYDTSGALDDSFGTDGIASVPVEGAIPSGVVADDGAVVVGGLVGPQPDTAWAARLDKDGNVDPSFGEEGVVSLLSDEEGEADLMVATGVHAIDGGYLAVVLTSDFAGDTVHVVTFDDTGVASTINLASADEIYAVDSTSTADGGVMVVLQVPTGEDVHDFHTYRFLPNGTLDPNFDNPGLSDDEVGGPVHLAGLRTGEVAVAYNTGPDAAFVIRLVTPDGEDGGTIDTGLDAWMYGIAAVAHDGSLLLAVDETPAESVQPDDLTVVKVVGDESGRFIDDDHSVHEGDIEALAGRDITRGCNPPVNSRFCPDDSVTRGQMAAFLVRALGLPGSDDDAFDDDGDSEFERDINALAAAGITRGCNPPENTRFCPDEPVSRGEMASFLIRALP